MIGRWAGVDPLAEKYSFQNPYAYATDNPILFRDIMGLGVDTIRMFDKNGTQLASFNNDSPNIDFTLDCEVSCDFEEINIDVPGDIDIVGLGASADIAGIIGLGGGTEFIAFLDGKNAGDVIAYDFDSKNLGLYAGAGLYGILGDFQGNKGDALLNSDDYLGKFFSYSIDIADIGISYFWGNADNGFQLWSGYLGGKTTWQGITFTSGDFSGGLLPSSVKVGVKFSEANYRYSIPKR